MTEAGYCRILLDKKDTQIMELESEITKLRIEYETQILKLHEGNEELQSKLNKAIECIKNIKEENKKLVHSNNLAERLVNMIPKFEYMSKGDKKLVVLEAEQYIKGVR